MHTPLHWLLFHSYCQPELVKSIWFKRIGPQTCGVYIFIRNTYVCSFVLSLAHFFHSRNSLSIFGVEAHQHSTTSSEHRAAFQHEADESTGLEKNKCERGSAVLFHRAARFGDHFPGGCFQEAACPISCGRGITAGWDSGLGVSGGLGEFLISSKGNVHGETALQQFFALGMSRGSHCTGGLIYCRPQDKCFCHGNDVCFPQVPRENREDGHRLHL